MLSREKMVATIQGGGSVLLPNGRLATRLEQLPSVAALAKTPEEKQAAASDLETQIAKLQAEKAELENQLNAGAKSQTGGDDTLDELMKHTREELLKKAAETGVEIKNDATKAEISNAILGAGK